MITYPRRYPQRDCLNKQVRTLLMVRRPETDRLITLATDKPYLVICATYINPCTGCPVRDVIIRLKAPTTVYLARSDKYQGWYYLVQWSDRAQKHLCTCKENLSQSFCMHIDDLPAATLSELA